MKLLKVILYAFYAFYVFSAIVIVSSISSCKNKEQTVFTIKEIKAYDTIWELTISSLDESIKFKNTVYTPEFNVGDTLYILRNGVPKDTIK